MAVSLPAVLLRILSPDVSLPKILSRGDVALIAFLLAALSIGDRARAQDAPPQATNAAPTSATPAPQQGRRSGGDRAAPQAAAANAELHALPADSTTHHTLALPGRSLAFTATAGSIALYNDKGEPQADIAYTAYLLDDTQKQNRPVTFVFNGGPGASSAYLQLGNAGPWRLPLDGDAAVPSASVPLQPNADTWLDFTDLVFIDPVGTGYSRFAATGDDVRKRFFSVDGDVTSLAVTIRRWLEKADRLSSPKYILAESYGGIRGPRVVRDLQTRQGIGIKGLMLISPLMDFRESSGSSILQYVASLPTMAAVARADKGSVTRADMADVENYARGDFLADLIKGEVNAEATTRLANRVAALIGIDPAVSRRLAGRFAPSEFRREFDRNNGRVTGRYDASVSGLDPDPDASNSNFDDPSGDALLAPLSSAAVELTRNTLNWRPDGPYELLSNTVSREWDFGRNNAPAQSVSQLRQILALDPTLKVLVAHGLFDLATPYFGSKILLDQLPPYATQDRVKLVVYPGGHMFYTRDASRQMMRGEAEKMIHTPSAVGVTR